jgi:serine/threonine protein kinase
MPARLEYDQAILFAETRLKVSRSDLREGQVETVKMGADTFPWGNQGGFAVVYKFRTKSGSMRALRCFTRPIDPDIKERYERMGSYFRAHAAEITTDFTYYDQGIEVLEMVNGQQQNKIFPIIDMEWIEGVTLFEYIEKLCKQREQAKLGEIANRWFDVVLKLRQANMAHGDLAAGNVMVRDDGRLVLIDYDGVYIQEFQGKKQLLLGTPGFQHPEMQRRPFNEWMDEFSSLVIFTTLLALQAQPTLWDTYVKYGSTGKPLDPTLLFTQKDFETPQQSSLFRDLERSPSAQVREAIKELKRACGQEVSDVRFPVGLGDPEYQKKQAQKALVDTFRAALATRSIERIVAAFDPQLDTYPSISMEERQVLVRARAFYQACQDEDDVAIEDIADEIRGIHIFSKALAFSAAEETRIQLAIRRKELVKSFKVALMTRRADRIVAGYDHTTLDTCKSITGDERQKVALAEAWEAARQQDRDTQLLAAWEAIERSAHAGFLSLTQSEEDRLDLARRRTAALDQRRQALGSKRDQRYSHLQERVDLYPGGRAAHPNGHTTQGCPDEISPGSQERARQTDRGHL